MRRVAALGACGALAASCSLATDLTSLSGTDASSDALAPDVAQPDVAQPDVVQPDSGTSCPGYPLAFACDDFDDGIASFWKQDISGGATAKTSTAQFLSPPASLLAETPNVPDAGPNDIEFTANLYDVVGGGMKHVRASYDLYIDEEGQRSAAIGGVYLGSKSTQNYGIVLYINQNSNTFLEDGNGDLSDGGDTSNPIASGFAIPMHTWTRMVMDVDFAGGTASLAATDPSTPPDASLNYLVPPSPIHPTLSGPNTIVYAGISYQVANAGQINATRVYVDDVVFERL